MSGHVKNGHNMKGHVITVPEKEMAAGGEATEALREQDAATPGNRRGTAGCWDRFSGLKNWWQQQTPRKKLVLVVSLSLSLVLAGIFIIAVSVASTQSPAPTQPPVTTQLPLTLEDQYKEEQQEVERLPTCSLTMERIDVEEYFRERMPDDELRGKIVTRYTYAWRCTGACDRGRSCSQFHTKDRDFVVAYRGNNGTILYTTRKMQDHTNCYCEEL